MLCSGLASPCTPVSYIIFVGYFGGGRPVSGELGEVRFREIHQDIDFIFTPFEILDRKGEHGNNFHPGPQTHLKNLPRHQG